MKKIKLTQNKYALVDDENFDYLNQWKWFYDSGYAANKSLKKTYMHRLIMKSPSGYEIDHIDRNRLNNQKSNLRVVDRSQNSINTGLRTDNKSGMKGVFWRSDKKKWSVYINRYKTRKYLGHFKNLRDAVLVRKNAEIIYHTI
jgi:hypothetical protein